MNMFKLTTLTPFTLRKPLLNVICAACLGFGSAAGADPILFKEDTAAEKITKVEKVVELPPTPLTQEERVKAAAQKWEQKVTPVMLGEAGRLVLTYGQSTPVLVCAPLKVCTLELEPGETVVDAPAIGDPVRWAVEVRHRDIPTPQTYFNFKVTEDADTLSNFTVITDRRVYAINLVKDSRVFTPVMSFNYPDTQAKKLKKRLAAINVAKSKKKATKKAAYKKKVKRTGVATSSGQVPADKLDFGYALSGSAAFKPVQVYSDGRKTYIVLPSKYNGPVPVLLAGKGESNKALNYRMASNGSRYIIDRVIKSAVLQEGRKRIKIRKTK